MSPLTIEKIADVIRAAGGEAVITRDDHPSGSDRVFEALQIIDPDESFQTVLNLQGDLPEMDPTIPAALVAALDRSDADLATLVTPATAKEAARPQSGEGGNRLGNRHRTGDSNRQPVWPRAVFQPCANSGQRD